ncbi:Lipopolysaccharide heptosyltransferase 1 [Pigmentiphaga humi]|uniref:Lipopolysaccharide heptosyltransferase 1 n=2 Tax=Pigmentiphaga humi TaxID=2478468 RepID=A0A3P4B1G9_9BURK|nr:Lipopolysaccharide heptosyltransferase 1 [Pigmentiphaga humi]
MGDIVHALPAVSDIVRHVPGARIDWIAEESFAAIPALHPQLNEVIPIALRRWRKAWWSAPVKAERLALRRRLQAERYDAVIDMQGLWKSALVARWAHGPLHGCDLRSARDPFASFFYRYRHRVVFEQSAVVRMRELAALSLGYALEGPPDFGIRAEPPAGLPMRYVAIMPSASRATKLWPEASWRIVLERLSVAGYAPLVFAGSEEEQARAQRLISGIDMAQALPRMGLADAAGVLAGASLVVGLDSGLTHLAGALGRPTVGIYADYDPALAPVTGAAFTASLGGKGTPPSCEQVLAAIGQALPAAEPGRGPGAAEAWRP